jgi:hypothetical protein
MSPTKHVRARYVRNFERIYLLEAEILEKCLVDILLAGSNPITHIDDSLNSPYCPFTSQIFIIATLFLAESPIHSPDHLHGL